VDRSPAPRTIPVADASTTLANPITIDVHDLLQEVWGVDGVDQLIAAYATVPAGLEANRAAHQACERGAGRLDEATLKKIRGGRRVIALAEQIRRPKCRIA
jgi:hypothetical protein